MSLQKKVHTKCTKQVDEQNKRLFRCLNVREFEPKLLIKGVQILKKKKMFTRS